MPQFGWFFLAVGSAIGFGISAFLMRLATMRSPEGRVYILLGLSISATVLFSGFGLATGVLSFPPVMLLLGTVMGLGTLLGNSLWIKAVHVGPTSLTQMLANTSTVLVVLLSIIVYGETLSITEVAAVLLLIGSASLLTFDPDESISIKDRIWFVYIIGVIVLLSFRVGGLKVVDEANLNGTSALVLTYAVGIIWFGTAVARAPRDSRPSDALGGMLMAAAAGVCSFIGLQLYSFALVDGPASIVAPIFAANGVVLAILTTTVLDEKLSRLQVVALIGLIAGLVLLRVDVGALRALLGG